VIRPRINPRFQGAGPHAHINPRHLVAVYVNDKTPLRPYLLAQTRAQTVRRLALCFDGFELVACHFYPFPMDLSGIQPSKRLLKLLFIYLSIYLFIYLNIVYIETPRNKSQSAIWSSQLILKW
jgi:hypothetical protein